MPLVPNESDDQLPQIQAGDFVNDGRNKFNLALGFIPKSYAVDPSTGELVITRYNGAEKRLKLANFFALLDDVAEYISPGMADTEKPGLMLLADPDDPDHLTSTQRVLSAAGVNQLIQLLKQSIPAFNTDGWEVGDIFTVQQTAQGIKFLRATNPDDFLFSLLENISDKTQTLFCEVADKCKPAKTASDFAVTGPDLIDEPASGSTDFQYYAIATFDDGTTGALTAGIVCSIIATAGETIDATGKVRVPHDATAGNNRQITVRIGYRLPGHTDDTVKQKVVTVRDSAGLVTLTPTGNVKYYEAAVTNPDPNPELSGGWKGSLDGGGCDKVSGWIVKLDNMEVSRTVDLYADGVKVASNIACTINRPDVRDYLRQNQNAPGLQNQTFGYEWTVPARFRKGKQIVWRAYVSGTQTELSYSPRTSDSCADETNHPPVLAGNFSGSHEHADCESTGGWVVNLSNLGVSPEVDVEINGVIAATVQAYGARQDVADAVGSTSYNLYQWKYMIADRFLTGVPLVIRAKIKGTNTLLTFSPRTTDACSNLTPTVQSRYIAKPNPSITEAGLGMQLTLMERMSSGPDRACPDPVAWGKPGNWPNGVTLSASGIIACADGAISENIVVTASATVGGNTETATVQVINTGCSRTTNGYVNVRLIYNFKGANSNSARLFTSLDDANNTMGAHYDGTHPGTFNTPYLVQLHGNYEIGTPVWFGDGTDCTKSDDGIRFSIDSTGGNTQVTAILITNGLIAERKTSTYQTPVSDVAIGNPCKAYLFDETTAPNANPVIFDENSVFNSTGLLAHFRIDSVNINVPIGAGLRGPDLLHGYALLLYPNQGTVSFTNQGVAFGPNFQFNWESGKSYWLRMQYFETDNNTAKILAAIWLDTQIETNVVFEWGNVPRLSGYPVLYGGSRSGSGGLFDKLYLYGCGSTTPTTPTQPPNTNSCANYAKATQAQYDGWEILNVYEFVPANGTRRAFASKAELMAAMQTLDSGSPTASIDRQRCSSSTASVGSILYGNNQPPDNDFNKWPAEAGFWVIYYDTAIRNKYILETNACGEIIHKEPYTA